MRKSALTLRMIASGVPSGATSTFQPPAKKPGSVSATVGRFGNSGSRLVVATAMPLVWPLSMPGPTPP